MWGFCLLTDYSVYRCWSARKFLSLEKALLGMLRRLSQDFKDALLQENNNSCTVNHPVVILGRGRMSSTHSLSSAIKTRFLLRIIIAQHSVELVLSAGWTLLDNTAQIVQKCQPWNPSNNTLLTHQATPMKIYSCDSGCWHTYDDWSTSTCFVLICLCSCPFPSL